MLEVIEESKVQEIHVYKMKNSDGDYFSLRFELDNQKYSVRTRDLEKFQTIVAQHERGKVGKTQIKLITEKTWDDKLKELIRNNVNIFLPLLFPILLYRSKLGGFFKSTMMGEADVIAKPNVLFKDIAGLGNAKI